MSEQKTLFDISDFPTAQVFIKAAVSGKYSVIVYGGAVRGGKSFNGVGVLVMLHTIYPQSRSCIIRKNLETLRRNTLTTCNKVIPKSAISRYNATEYRWTFHNGSYMFFFGENYDEVNKILTARGFYISKEMGHSRGTDGVSAIKIRW